jgi:hypothetical protein
MLQFKIRLSNLNTRIQVLKTGGSSYSIDWGITGPSRLCSDTSVEIEEGRKKPRVK